MSYFGVYRAIVAATNDPDGLGRLRLRVPQITGQGMTTWAWPMAPATALPAVGEGVFAMFEGGDLAYPLWTGNFAGSIVQATKGYTDAHSVAKAGDTMSGSLVVSGSELGTYGDLFSYRAGAPGRVRLGYDGNYAASISAQPQGLSVTEYSGNNLLPLRVADPSTDDHATTRRYVNNRSGQAYLGIAPTSISWNDVTDPGVYKYLMHSTSNPNGPLKYGAYYYLHTYQYAGTLNRTQIAVPYRGGNTTWIRDYYDGNWTAWTEDDVAKVWTLSHSGGVVSNGGYRYLTPSMYSSGGSEVYVSGNDIILDQSYIYQIVATFAIDSPNPYRAACYILLNGSVELNAVNSSFSTGGFAGGGTTYPQVTAITAGHSSCQLYVTPVGSDVNCFDGWRAIRITKLGRA